MRYEPKITDDVFIRSQIKESDGSIFSQQSFNQRSVDGSVQRSDIVHNRTDVTGWRPPSPYTVVDETTTYGYGYRWVRHERIGPGIIDGTTIEVDEGPCGWIGDYYISGFNPYRVPPDVYASLVNKTLLKLRDQKINLGLAFAELDKTASGVAQSVTKVATSLRAFRRGDFKRALSSLGLSTRRRGRDAASTWLELQYGILPLMGDVHGGYEEVTRKLRNHGQRVKVMSRFSGSIEPVDVTYPNISTGFDAKIKATSEGQAQLILWYEVKNPALLAASAVGLTNPLEIIWEITPWSFVVDWFLPVGDFLGALTASQGFQYLGGTYTTRRTDSVISKWSPRPPRYLGNWETDYFACAGERKKLTRRIDRQVVYVEPTAFLPRFKNPLSVGHALNALALLRTIR